jgi:hypothetical protein
MPRGFSPRKWEKTRFSCGAPGGNFPSVHTSIPTNNEKAERSAKKNDFRVNLINKAKEEVTLFSM